MAWIEEVERKAEPIRRAILNHPVTLGIGRGDLDIEKFKHYIRQDYLYLIEYSRTFAIASARAHDLETQTQFAKLLDETLNVEMGLHRGYCGRFGITEAELEATEPVPTTLAYTRFLLETAYGHSWEECVASLLPCQWGYWDIGSALLKQGRPSHAPLYAEWVDMYTSPEFRESAHWIRGLADRLAAGTGPATRERMTFAYLTSLKYEYLFWEMAWNLEGWPV